MNRIARFLVILVIFVIAAYLGHLAGYLNEVVTVEAIVFLIYIAIDLSKTGFQKFKLFRRFLQDRRERRGY